VEISEGLLESCPLEFYFFNDKVLQVSVGPLVAGPKLIGLILIFLLDLLEAGIKPWVLVGVVTEVEA